jgi:transposase
MERGKPNTKKRYTQEFKQEAVKLVTEQGYSQAEASRCLGICSNNLSRWVQEVTRGKPLMKPTQHPEQAELEALRKENKRLKLERDILKKATAIFSSQ